MADSTVTLVGNLTRDPELRFTQGGLGVTTLGVAVNNRRQVNGEWQEQTSFFNVTVFGQLGENAATSLHKGYRVVVTGRLQQREYETREGEKRSVVEVVADEVAPSLRWATAQVERISRSTNESAAPAGAPSPAGGRSPEPAYGDEEPF